MSSLFLDLSRLEQKGNEDFTVLTAVPWPARPSQAPVRGSGGVSSLTVLVRRHLELKLEKRGVSGGGLVVSYKSPLIFSAVAVSVVEDTAHPKLVFSQGGRYVKNGASASSWPLFSSAWSYVSGWRNSQNTQFVGRFQHLPCVLGKNIFTSGKHYWEVENRDSLEIAVGVCRGDVMGLADGSEMCPHMGIWALSWGSTGYRPLTSSPVSPTKQEPALQRVGVFLDSDAGDISFYSAVDGTHLHTFSCPLASRLRPFFWLSPLASLVIPAVTARK